MAAANAVRRVMMVMKDFILTVMTVDRYRKLVNVWFMWSVEVRSGCRRYICVSYPDDCLKNIHQNIMDPSPSAVARST